MRPLHELRSNRPAVIVGIVMVTIAGALTWKVSYFLVAFAGWIFLWLARRLSEVGLDDLDLAVEVPNHAFEGDSVLLELTLENHGDHVPSFMQIQYSFGASMVDVQTFPDPRPLPPWTRRTLRTHASCSRRWGSYRVGPFVVERTDPLGLSTSRREFPIVEEFSLFPNVFEIPKLFERGGHASFSNAFTQRDRSGSSDLTMGIREYRAGDERRRVHWRATAHRGTLMVKEVEQDLTPLFTLFLDLAADHRAGTGRKSTLEFVMRTGACLLWSATKRRQHIQVFADDGVGATAVTDANSTQEGGTPLEISSGSGEVHLAYALQRLLAVQQGWSTFTHRHRHREAPPPSTDFVAGPHLRHG